jgi:DNA-binding PadR family transcriptional regulator
MYDQHSRIQAHHCHFHHRPRHAGPLVDDDGDDAGWDLAGRGGRGPHGGHRGFRHFGFGGGGPGGFGFRAGRKLSASDLQLLLLHLLGKEPRHGYELIKAVEELSSGFYVPSPGVIYPALTYLEELGDAASTVEGTRKRYQLTDAGRARLEARAADVKDLLEQLAHVGRGMDRVREAFAGEDPDAAEAGPDDAEGPFGGRGGFPREARPLRAAFRALRSALHATRDASREELDRVAEILLRAADQIRGGRR